MKHLSNVHKALGGIPRTGGKKKKKKGERLSEIKKIPDPGLKYSSANF
jgi:hypothetical protein